MKKAYLQVMKCHTFKAELFKNYHNRLKQHAVFVYI